MNPLFSLPLHGICCVPNCGQNLESYVKKVHLNFCNINTNIQQNPIWELKDEGERYLSTVSLFKKTQQQNKNIKPSYLLKIDCQGRGVFEINENSINIDWKAEGTDSAHYFQTLGAALYLEINNILCIHANALAFKDNAIAIVAPSRTGKTTLTAALSQNGFALMTDDMMALHLIENNYVIYPSWPILRMWPDALEEFQKSASEDSKKVHQKFDKRLIQINNNDTFKFCNEPKKLKTIYLLNRIDNKIDKRTDKKEITVTNNNSLNNTVENCEISDIKPAEAVIILLQNSILGSAYKALELEDTRLTALSTLLTKIQFKKITYTSGKNNLLNVCKNLKQDIEK